MSVTLSITLRDGTLRKVAAAAREHEISIETHIRLIIEAAVALYEIEDQTAAPAGPATVKLRPRRWRVSPHVDRIIGMAQAPEALTAALLGDPPPGRSALDEKRGTTAR